MSRATEWRGREPKLFPKPARRPPVPFLMQIDEGQEHIERVEKRMQRFVRLCTRTGRVFQPSLGITPARLASATTGRLEVMARAQTG